MGNKDDPPFCGLSETLLTSRHRESFLRLAPATDSAFRDCLSRCLAHLKEAEDTHRTNVMVNLALASAMVDVFQELGESWETLHYSAQQCIKVAMLYFVDSDDEEPDWSPIGFEDDVEVLNLCLAVAGRSDLAIDAEVFDDA